MENFLFKTKQDVEIELSESDMMAIHEHYMEQAIADELRCEYEWPEEKIQEIAKEMRWQMYKYGYSEACALEEAKTVYKNKHEKVKFSSVCNKRGR